MWRDFHSGRESNSRHAKPEKFSTEKQNDRADENDQNWNRQVHVSVIVEVRGFLNFLIPRRQISPQQLLQLFDVETEGIDQSRSQLVVDLVRVRLLEDARFRWHERAVDAEKFKDSTQRFLVLVSQFIIQENQALLSAKDVKQSPDLRRVESATDVGINAMLQW